MLTQFIYSLLLAANETYKKEINSTTELFLI
jgi:hypothetical protein